MSAPQTYVTHIKKYNSGTETMELEPPIIFPVRKIYLSTLAGQTRSQDARSVGT